MDELVSVFKALSDETRLRIVKLLENGELCVCHLVAALHMGQPKVSFHLKAMKEAGLVKDRREGKWMHYRLNESDPFRRLLFLSVMDRADDKRVAEDRRRLGAFVARQGNAGPSVELFEDPCCGKR